MKVKKYDKKIVILLNMTTTDEKYMMRCLYLAKLGESAVSPNPMVGAVVVCRNRIIGEGYHYRYGELHAEPMAISNVKNKELLPESTLYVNLEPCSHYGKTPPCAQLIISKKIKRVVVGCLDPNPRVSGKGVEMLKNAGIEVRVGVLEPESRRMNRRFICFHEKKRPYIILKWAQTRDGFMDIVRDDVSTSALAISNAVTRQLTHKMRVENMSILVSTNTVALDNPALTARHWEGKSPLRLAIDRHGKIPEHFQLKTGKVKTVIFTSKDSESKPNLEYVKMGNETDNLPFILQKLYDMKIHSVLVEGGAKLLNSFIESRLWDEANIEISPVIIGRGILAPALTCAEEESRTVIENHLWIHYHKENDCSDKSI